MLGCPRWLLALGYRLSWLAPHLFSRRGNGSGKRILAVWDFRTHPLSVGDCLHTQVYSQALREAHGADKVDVALLIDIPSVLLARLGLSEESFHYYFAQIFPVTFVNSHLGMVSIWDSCEALVNYVAAHENRYILAHPRAGAGPTVYRWTEEFQYLKWFHQCYGRVPLLSCQTATRHWATAFLEKHAAGRLPVSLQLRCNINNPSRNANVDAWLTLVDECERNATEVCFFLLGAREEIDDRFSQYDNVCVVKNHATTIEQDLAIMETSAFHLGSNSGPATMAIFGDRPYVIYSYCSSIEALQEGHNMPWAGEFQKLVWERESVDCVRADFEWLWRSIERDEWHREFKERSGRAKKILLRTRDDGSLFSGGAVKNNSKNEA